MDQQKLKLSELTPALRKLFAVIEQHGPLGAPDLHADLPLNGNGGWKGRNDGMTTEFRRLQTTGLIRQKGTRPSPGGPATRVYEVTPVDQIKQAAEAFKRTRPSTRKRDMTGTAARIAEYRRREREEGPTARKHWIEKRRRILELGQTIRDLEPMAYWSEKSVPADELEEVYDELVKVVAWGARMEAAVDSQRGDRQLREKIKALRAKADSTEFKGEADLFRMKARELERKLS